MKKIIFLLFINFGFSQHIVKNEIDEFTKNNVIQVNCSKKTKWATSDNVTKGIFKYLFFSLNNYKNDTTSVNTFNIDISTGSLLCFSKSNGIIIFLFDDESTLELNQTSKLDCETRQVVKYSINNNDLIILKTKRLSKIRIYTTDGYLNFEIKENKQQIIKETFQLFYNTIQ